MGPGGSGILEAMSVATVLAWVLVFGVLIAVHELGHFLVAKRVGIRVEEFSLGFGPRLWGRVVGETLYAVRAVPLGGYVRMTGMDGEHLDDPRAFGRQAVWQRLMVILAGPIMNLVLAAFLYVIVFGPIGTPVPTTTVGGTVPGYPAARAGVRPGDQVIAVDGQPVRSWNGLAAAIARDNRRPVRLTVRRPDGTVATYVLGAQYYAPAKSRIVGIEPAFRTVHLPVFPAIAAGVDQTVALTGQWFVQLGRLLTGSGPFDVAGPVGIAVMVGQAVQQGFVTVILLAAALSANLGLFNVLPVPVLDGSRLWLLVLEAVRRRPLDPVKENLIHMVGLVMLLLFVVFVTYHDLLSLMG
jgi:regulator of sigma E protease